MNDYRTINLCFVVIFFLGALYCFFLNSVPESFQIQSYCISHPSLCKSIGLTRAFNEALHLNFKNALKLNPYYLQIFIFFGIQFMYRLISGLLIKVINKKVIWADAILSGLYFIMTFYVFIV